MARQTQPAKAKRPTPGSALTFSPLTDLQKIAGSPLKGTTGDGREVLFGQISISDLAAFEQAFNLPASAINDPTYRVTAWAFLALRSLLHHKTDATPADVDALFPPTARGIELLGEVVVEVLPRGEEPAQDPADEKPSGASS